MFLVEALISDETGNIRAIWFNQPYLKIFSLKGSWLIRRQSNAFQNKLYFSNPVYEIIQDTG